jgi:hypothetical protein
MNSKGWKEKQQKPEETGGVGGEAVTVLYMSVAKEVSR